MDIRALDPMWSSATLLPKRISTDQLEKPKNNKVSDSLTRFSAEASITQTKTMSLSLTYEPLITDQYITSKKENEDNIDEDISNSKSSIEELKSSSEITEIKNDPFMKLADDFTNLFLTSGFSENETNDYVGRIVDSLRESLATGIEQIDLSFSSSKEISFNDNYSKSNIISNGYRSNKSFSKFQAQREITALMSESISISMNTKTGELNITTESVKQLSVKVKGSMINKNVSRLKGPENLFMDLLSFDKKPIKSDSRLNNFFSDNLTDVKGINKDNEFFAKDVYHFLNKLLKKFMEDKKESQDFFKSIVEVKEVKFEYSEKHEEILKFTMNILTPISEKEAEDNILISEKNNDPEAKNNEENVIDIEA